MTTTTTALLLAIASGAYPTVRASLLLLAGMLHLTSRDKCRRKRAHALVKLLLLKGNEGSAGSFSRSGEPVPASRPRDRPIDVPDGPTP